MNTIKFIVKVSREGIHRPQYVQRIDPTPIQMTSDRKLALLMGKLTAEDAVKLIQTLQCTPELVSVRVNEVPLKKIMPEILSDHGHYASHFRHP
jgi:hypothetical protein